MSENPVANGKPLAVLDEGITVDADVASLDFVGAGVEATGDADVEVNVAGGGGYSPSVVQIDDADSPYTPTANGQLIECDSSSGAIEIDLSGIADPTGWGLGIVVRTAGNNVTTDVNVDGSPLTLSFVGDGRTIYYNGTEWKTRLF